MLKNYKLVEIIMVFLILLSGLTFTACSQEESKMETTKKNIMVVAHRGASGHAPENTLSAMKKAIEMNAEMSELDVQETADGEIILLHDGSLKRTSGVDKNIWETNYADLKDLDVGAWFSEEYKNEPIPTMKEVIDLVKGKMRINIELKANKHEKMLAERTLKIIEANNFIDQVIFTSFKFAEADRIRELNPKAKVGYIFGRLPKDVDVFTADIDLLSVNIKSVDAEFMKKAKANYKEVHVWTVNEPKDMKRMIELDVDAIITNYPDVLRKVLDGKL